MAPAAPAITTASAYDNMTVEQFLEMKFEEMIKVRHNYHNDRS